ncbi:MAG: hypothetical protein Q9190_006653 [Brigantiaea leucoxantha]
MEQDLSSASAPESRVLIIMTGGTICMTRSPEGFIPARGFLDSCLAPRPSFNDGSESRDIDVAVAKDTIVPHRSLRTPMSTYQKHVRYAVLEFDNLGKAVVLTGSQAPMLELQNDATDNLLGSLIIAGHFMIPEVCLFFNYKLFRGNRATKVSASDFSAFASPNMPPLATITSSKTAVSWELVQRPRTIEPFSIRTHGATAHVACLRIFPGIKPEMVDAVLNVKGLKGLVLETFGSGNAPGGPDGAMTKVFAAAVQRGIVVVNVTQCMTGTVGPFYQPAMLLTQAGIVPGHDMTSEAALTKLSYLLGHASLSTDDVAKQMSVSIRGELTAQSAMTFQHPVVQLSGHLADLTALGYAISSGDVVEVQRILKGQVEWLLGEADYSGNSPLHIAATGPSIEILELLLLEGASVHLRNKTGRTPLFLAAHAGLADHASLLQASGAHLHADELAVAKLHAQRNPLIWQTAGVQADKT